MNTQERVNQALFGKTELKSEKVELKIGDNLDNLNKKAEKAYQELNKELDTKFEKVRQAESIIRSLKNEMSTDFNGFKSFMTALQNFESQYSKDVNRLRSASEELGIKIDTTPAISKAVKDLQNLQDSEALLRRDINEYTEFAKKIKSF